MSEQVQIVLTEGENEIKIKVQYGVNLLQALAENGLLPAALGHCGGAGRCGRCIVRFCGNVPLPGAADRRFLTAAELREGYRLACGAAVKGGGRIELHFREQRRTDTVAVCTALSARPRRKPDAGGERAYAAVDVGTTTVAAELIAMRDGAVLADASFLNPQRAYGADVMSRVLAAGAGRAEQLRLLLAGKLEDSLRRFPVRPDYAVLAANTVMGHLLLGLDVSGLGAAPFTPVSLRRESFTLAGIPAFVLPGVSAFIGADIMAGLFACGFGERTRPALLVDLGTNGEMVLGTGKRMVAASAAAGPAFEGVHADGAHGADRMAAVAALLREGILDADGLLREPYFTEGIQRCGVYVTQKDVRSFQTAKAAVLAGIRLLLREYGISAGEVEQVCLAGGFGYYLRPEDAFRTGLLPEAFAGRTETVGNTALAGAALLGENYPEEEVRRLIAAVKPLNLAETDGFYEEYMRGLRLEVVNRQ